MREADKTFEKPVIIGGPDGRPIEIHSVVEARDILVAASWPKRGARHRDAVDACLKVLDGHRSTVDARAALIDAALEASILIGD
jgi:hypothetical protein